MGAVQPLRKHATRSPEREALAAAIAAHKGLLAEIAAVDVALSSAWSAIVAAERDAERAAARIEEAKANAAKFQTDTLLGKAGAAPVSIREARAAAQDADDALATAREARAALAEHRESLTGFEAVSLKKDTIERAAMAVVRAELDANGIYDRFVRAYREFADARALLGVAEGLGISGGAIRSYDREPADFTHPTANALQAAIAALETDPDAPLPRIENAR